MNKAKILVVDDNSGIRAALQLLLPKYFKEIKAVASPNVINSQLREFMPDVILLDMNFTLGVNSGQDGLLWLRMIHRQHPDIPVVLITAYADVELAVRGLKTGAADFITKPWDNDELIRTLKDVLEQSREVVSLEQVELEHVRKVVDKCHGNISKAAEMLGITRQTLYAKMKR